MASINDIADGTITMDSDLVDDPLTINTFINE